LSSAPAPLARYTNNKVGDVGIRIPMNPTRRTNVDNHPVLPILHPEIRRRGPNQLERRRVVHR
jgi:hypothetical protein